MCTLAFFDCLFAAKVDLCIVLKYGCMLHTHTHTHTHTLCPVPYVHYLLVPCTSSPAIFTLKAYVGSPPLARGTHICGEGTLNICCAAWQKWLSTALLGRPGEGGEGRGGEGRGGGSDTGSKGLLQHTTHQPHSPAGPS